MLNLSKTRSARDIERPVEPGIDFQEGMALVSVLVNGTERLVPSTGTDGDDNHPFVGFSLAEVIVPRNRLNFQDIVVPDAPGPYTALLARTPIAGSLRFVNADTGVEMTIVAIAPAAGEVQVVGTSLTFNAAQAGANVVAISRVDLTVAEATLIQGVGQPRGPAVNYINTTGVIIEGDVYTDQIDTAVDWSTANDPANEIVTAPNGLITVEVAGAGTGAVVPAYVIEIPSAESPFLGLRLRA